ncbi:MAG: 2-dehydropantoate 2-reductase [Proteobacteria bacterium]|nr:2-dehydropantoate 2-reductase [Pseudomonadota bacterium]
MTRFAVIGIGGAGGYFGGRLVEAGHDVAFIARGAHLAAIRASGLRIDSISGDFIARPTRATDDPAEVGVVDYVILGVKAWQVPEAVRGIAALVGPSTTVLPLQNGVEAATQIAHELGAGHALGGIAKIISFVEGPGHIKHVGAAPTVELGELDATRSERVVALQAAFARAKGVTAVIPADIQVAMWAKFLFITAWSGVGAVTRAPLGVIRGVPETRQLLEAAMQEIAQVARGNAVQLPSEVVATTMAFVDSLPAHGTTSMQRDLADGKPSELACLCGAVTRLGLACGVPTPTNAALYQALVPLERRARGELAF